MGDARVTAEAKKIAYRLDPRAIVERRPTPTPTAPSPSARRPRHDICDRTAAGGARRSVYAALRRPADTCCDGRSRGQVMANTLSNESPAAPRPPRLRSPSIWSSRMKPCWRYSTPPISRAMAPFRRPSPARWSRARPTDGRAGRRCAGSTPIPDPGRWWRWSRGRRFPRGLAAFIGLRDQRCRTPYCDAPIRTATTPNPGQGGPTTAPNGLGSCERCNYAKEAHGWRVSTRMTKTTPTQLNSPHQQVGLPLGRPTTPAGDHNQRVEVRVGIALARHAA